tara:strand:- start:47 stop:1447 length:1401 start_codon:yes stop_codon:yes gene_type:complete
MSEQNPLVDFVSAYKDDPVAFVREILGAEPFDYQQALLVDIANGERKISVRSGHGTGKSTTFSWAMLWFAMTRFPFKVVVTAPTSGQLFDALFAELKRWINELPEALRPILDVKNDRVSLIAAPSEGFISARTSRAETPEALAGVHSANVMLVVDEASGVPEQVFEAAAGSMSGHSAVTLLASNPTRSSGTFFETQTRLSGSWKCHHWSCIKSPLVSRDFIEEMKLRYGEESNAYRIRVLGEFPLADDDTIVPFHLVDAAVHRDIEPDDHATVIWGLDVARFGSDKTALAKRQGNTITEINSWQGLDLMQTVGRVKAEYDGLPMSIRPSEIMVDVIGMGGGVVDRLRELGLPVRGINVAESPSMKDTYTNLRAELWFKMRGWLEQRGAKLPRNEQLIAELTSIRYSFVSSGKMKAEGKDDMRKRGLASPDLADAVCLTLASDAATALGGKASTWGKPLRRNLKGVA